MNVHTHRETKKNRSIQTHSGPTGRDRHELTAKTNHQVHHERVRPSTEFLQRMAGIKKKNRALIDTATGSANTSFDSVMSDESNSPSPCCSCLPHKKKLEHDIGHSATANIPHHKESSVISSSHSIGTGWFSPDTGKVVLYGPQEHQNQVQLHNPFIDRVNGYLGSYKNIISAEQLVKDMHLGEQIGVTENVPGKLLEEHDIKSYYSNMDQMKFLESGGAFYSFTCRTWMTPYEREMVEAMANLSSFEDETRDNYVPHLDINNAKDVNQYTYVLQKAAYILPGVNLEDVTPEVLSSNHYHECCQPVNGTKIWDHWEEDVFRFTRPIIPHIYKMTIQFKVSEVQKRDLGSLSDVLGVRIDKAILMERTKRSVPPKIDATAKAKSILCYTVIPGGLLVTHATVILNTAIPTVVAKVVHTFGGMGLAETCETAERTRLFFFKMRS